MARKRKSMREGPLSELFRATDQAGKEPPEETVEAVSRPRPNAEDDAVAAYDNVKPLRQRDSRPVESPPSIDDAGREDQMASQLPFEESPDLDSDAPPEESQDLRENEDAAVSDRPAAAFAQPVLSYAASPSQTQDTNAYLAVIRVVGVGGAGLNALERMMEAGISQVDFVAMNTDIQQLQASQAPMQLHIGRDLTHGLGSGADPEVGREAAEASYDEIKNALRGSDMVFVTAGEGGGTGTGAAPVVARIAREVGALTVGIVTTPFRFEGSRRRSQSDAGVEELRAVCDTVIVIPNDRLLEVLERDVAMVEAFRIADDVLRQGVQGICDLITMPGLINLDFADVRTIMSDAGSALMGIGFATGENRAKEAAERALGSPLIDTEITGAQGILLSVAGGDDLTLFEVNEASEVIRQAATTDTNIIFGATVDPALQGQLWITVIATGLGETRPKRTDRNDRGDALDPPSFMRDL
jgi:cell division protein FtsZ